MDAHLLLSYREAEDGQVLEEGICEAGAMASFAAAGSSYASFGEPMIPMYIFYSMFGFQRTGDQAWLQGDQRVRGFLTRCHGRGGPPSTVRGCSTKTATATCWPAPTPTSAATTRAFAYEIAVIIQDGLHRMFYQQEDWVYYLTLQNEAYPQPAMPDDSRQGILDGLYLFRPAAGPAGAFRARAQLLGSGSILMEVLKAQELLAKGFQIGADVWSATSYLALRREALARGALQHAPPGTGAARTPDHPDAPGRTRAGGGQPPIT